MVADIDNIAVLVYKVLILAEIERAELLNNLNDRARLSSLQCA